MRTTQELNSLALRTRRLWNEDAYSPIDIFALVNGWKKMKITLVKMPLSKNISGMCTKEKEDVIICINSNTSYGRQRFTLAHELYHILYEPKTIRIICGMEMNINKSDSEKEADIFASYLLMPYDALLEFHHNYLNWNIEKMIDVEQFYQMSHQALLYRLVSDGLLSRDSAEKYKTIKVSYFASKLGYENHLYLPTDNKNQYYTTGEYIRKVEELTDRDLISNGKKEELLLAAYRSDLVYGIDEEDYMND